MSLSNWSIIAEPQPQCGGGNLQGVSCVSAPSCIGSRVLPGLQTLVESWNGSTWSIIPSPNPVPVSEHQQPPGSVLRKRNELHGSRVLRHPGHWSNRGTGSTWSIVRPQPKWCGATGILQGVSMRQCNQLHGGRVLLRTRHWWSRGTAAPGRSSRAPTQVAAQRRLWGSVLRQCNELHGGRILPHDSAGYETLVESWNGSTWSIIPSPNGPKGSVIISSYLFGVSCVSATDCTAVGDSGAQTLVESWNGSTWSIIASPNTSSGDIDNLLGVSCVSATDCTAVGYAENISASPIQTLIESWNGSTWSLVVSPNPNEEY